MTNASRDGNFVPTLICASSTDGTTLVPVYVKSTNNTLQVSDGTGGTDFGTPNASRDGNFVPALMAVSSADGITPVAVYAEAATGKILINTL